MNSPSPHEAQRGGTRNGILPFPLDPSWYETDPEDAAAAARAKAGRRAARRNARAGKTVSGDPAEKGSPAKAGKRPPKSARQGLWGEKTAEAWLVRNAGLKTVGRRVKVGRDEIDLVMEAPPAGKQPGEIVFVEVKTRASGLFGGGIASVDRRKRHALGRAAARWMTLNADRPMRMDVVEVYGDCESGRVDRVVHREAAVSLEKRFDAVSLCRRMARALRTPASVPQTGNRKP